MSVSPVSKPGKRNSSPTKLVANRCPQPPSGRRAAGGAVSLQGERQGAKEQVNELRVPAAPPSERALGGPVR